MKTIISFFILLIVLTKAVSAQTSDDTTLSKMKLNFVVPDIPAFKILGTDLSNLLRPATPKAIAISLSSFNDNGKLVVPKSFALELSPALLLNSTKGPAELKQYSKNAVANSFRISVGTNSDTLLSEKNRNLAIGVRISLIDEGDFGTDEEFQKKVINELRNFRLGSDTALKEFAISINKQNEYKNDPDVFEDKYKNEFKKYMANTEQTNQSQFSAGIKKLKEEYKKKHWNDEKLDLALAVLSSSPDSLLKNLKFNQAQLWLIWAHKINKNNKSQIVLGLNTQITKNLADTGNPNKSYFNLSLPVRYFVGTNKVKGFAEGQYNYDGAFKDSKVLLSLGTEISIIDGVWINLYAGFNYNTKTSTTSTLVNFNLKLTLPENFKFF